MASQNMRTGLSQGYVSGRDHGDYAEGELVAMQNAYYKPGDPRRVWKKPGRTEFGQVGPSGAIKGVALCQFDDGGIDQLLAYSGNRIFNATPGVTGSFQVLIPGLDPLATGMSVCHDEDRWYICNGYDPNQVLKPDGTVRQMGISRPVTAPTVVTNTAGNITRPTANSGVFTDPANAYDANDATFATNVAGPPYITQQHIWSGWGSSTAASRTLSIEWDYGSSDAWTAKIYLYKSEDGGGTWDQILYEFPQFSSSGVTKIQVTANSNLVQVKAIFSVERAVGLSVFYIKEILIEVGSAAAPFDTEVGLYYGFTEYDENEDQEGPMSPISALVALTGGTHSSATLALPTKVNTRATAFRIYRTVDGVDNSLSNFTRLDQIAASSTSYTDNFALDKDTASDVTYALISVSEAGGELLFERDLPPPPFRQIVSWQNALGALSKAYPRAWFFTSPGLPESWPACNINRAFPLAERDELVAQLVLGETMVFLAKGAVLATETLPQIVNGSADFGSVRVLKGQPGCVGEQAFCPFSVEGEPRGAWISPFGVHMTNGNTTRRISDDLDWRAEVVVDHLSSAVLSWDPENLILWMEHDSDGDGLNDRETPIHVGEGHQKANGMPKFGQPTPKATSCMTGGLVAASYRRYSGHPSDGKVYVESIGTVDAAATTQPSMLVKSPVVGPDNRTVEVHSVSVEHSDWGDGVVGALTVTVGNDHSQRPQVRTATVGLDGERATQKSIERAGDWAQFSFEYDGEASGGIVWFDALIESPGLVGNMGRV